MKDIVKFVLWCCLVLTLGYQITKTEHINANEKSPNVPKISIKLVQKKRNPHNTIYTFRLQNESNQIIKQSSVYLRYNELTGQSIKRCPFKIEAMGNKLNIKPNETITLKVPVPKETGLHSNWTDVKQLELEVVGYIKNVSNEYRFRIMIKLK